jgi:flagellar basal-body rod protein FlgG
MNSGLYAALSGGLASMKRMDVLANNLANSNTTGFKKGSIQFESVLAGISEGSDQSGSPMLRCSCRSSTASTSRPTGKQDGQYIGPCPGRGRLFRGEHPEGKAYTRQGNFRLDASGKLVTADGREVLGRGAPIVINGSSVSFDSEGRYSWKASRRAH